ncbi:hypothetical protein RCH18_000272 [Flavobacterium sp. PL11]|uniref:hypothetical protein n=1 Tax=Flavobacterium sp. PL11 TaxID=3071717 RepID=UPI002DFE08E2|nr:hypothetical protein [Flavobacterium sp. PL11]
MIEPIIGFSIFLTLVVLFIRNTNNSLEKEYDIIIESLNDNLKLFIEQAKCSNTTLGINNRGYLFKNCDLYLTNDALIIFGYTKDSFFKQLSKPIILTKEITKYKNKFSFAIVKYFENIVYNPNDKYIYIKFGEVGLTETFVKFKIEICSESDKNNIKLITDNF